MSLRVVVAAPFRQRGTGSLAESEFVVALSLDRDWFSPDQAKRVVDIATGEGLLEREDGALTCGFDPDGVTVPADFVPDDDVLRERSTFERVLDALVDAGVQKQEAVAGINDCQQRLDVTVEAAAIAYGRREGVDVAPVAAQARGELEVDGGANGGEAAGHDTGAEDEEAGGDEAAAGDEPAGDEDAGGGAPAGDGGA